MKTIGIIQSGYIPWRGYFDFIDEVDTFVFLEDVQYTRRDWRSRNRIKTRAGAGNTWLSVPVVGGRDQLIENVKIDYSQKWIDKHLDTIRHSYGKAAFFEPLFSEFSSILRARIPGLSDLNRQLTGLICEKLGITTPMLVSGDLGVAGIREEKLIGIVRALEGDTYLSGPTAATYMNPVNWENAGLQLRYKDYSGYPEYRQVSEPFEANVSIIDTIFMQGPDLQTIMGPRTEKRPA